MIGTVSPNCVCIHSLAQATRVLLRAAALGCPVTLVSAPGAAGNAGCGWWRALIQAAALPVGCSDMLDCGDAAGHAMAALRAGQRRLILDPRTPAYAAVQGAATTCGAEIIPLRPDCLDIAAFGADHRLDGWLIRARPEG